MERIAGNINIARKHLDLFLYTSVGKIGVEVNATKKSYVHPRNMSYLCDIYASHTLSGKIYNEDTKIIQINLSYGLTDNKSFREYKMMDTDNKLFVSNFIIYEFNMEYYSNIWYTKNEKEIDKYKYLIMLDLDKDSLKDFTEISKDKVVSKYMKEVVEVNKDPKFR